MLCRPPINTDEIYQQDKTMTGIFGEYCNWRILIWRFRRGYWRCIDRKNFNLAVFNLAINGQIRQIAKLKLPPLGTH